MYRTLKSPLSVQIEITDNCNQVCSHCYRACQTIQKSKTKNLTTDKVIQIVDELARNEVLTVTFTGGEPLMHKDVLRVGIERARKHGIVCSTNTNLQLLNREMAEVFLQNDVGILTSLLSFDEAMHDKIANFKGAHKRLLKNIHYLVGMGVKVGANMVVRKDNAHQVYETGKLACELGVRQFSATKVAPSPGTDYCEYKASPKQIKSSLDALLRIKEEYKVFVEILETYPLCFFQDLEKYSHFLRRNCTAAVFNCSISPDGSVRPCPHADMSYGNLFEQSLRDCWLAMDDWRNGEYLNEVCRECDYLMQCTGGCRIDAKHYYGNIKGRDPLMTHPSKIINTGNLSKQISIPDILSLNPLLMTRKEEFGGVARYLDEIVLLNHEGLSMLDELRNKKSFAWKNIQAASLTEKDLVTFFEVLYQKKMVM